jgi:hypothetical protein
MNLNESRDVLTTMRLGFRVDRATAALPASTTGSLFLITGGPIEVTLLIGEVTDTIQNSDPQLSVTSRATTGTAVVLNSTADTTSLEIGGFIRVNGNGGALILSNGGACLSSAYPSSFVVPIGNIAAVTQATKTGSVKWTIYYQPLAEGAIVTAA